MADTFPWLPYLLQTSDALFPTGAYAHSLGFEEIVRLGIVRDEASLALFLTGQIVPALQNLELPYLRFAFNAASSGDLEETCALDHEIGAWKLPHETRQASIQLGIRRIEALRIIRSAPLLASYSSRIETGIASGHHLVVSALQAAIENVPLEAALIAWFYQSLAANCAAALKLIRIGQHACQRVLRSASAQSESVLRHSLTIARHDAGCFNPLLEIASMRHAFAEERLFIS
jgi:urease accessory protein